MNAYCMFSQIRMRYFWPGCYHKLVCACPGWALANPSKSKRAGLVYNFLITAPMMVLMVDDYKVGAHKIFGGKSYHLVATCAMTWFAASESTTEANAQTFAAAIMKLMLRHVMAHILVVNKNSKFWVHSKILHHSYIWFYMSSLEEITIQNLWHNSTASSINLCASSAMNTTLFKSLFKQFSSLSIPGILLQLLVQIYQEA